MDQDNEQKRKHLRVRVELRVYCTSKNVIFSDYTRNLSEGGIMIQSQSLIERGEEISLNFNVPDHPIPINLMGEVVWSKSQKDKDGNTNILVGVKFKDAT